MTTHFNDKSEEDAYYMQDDSLTSLILMQSEEDDYDLDKILKNEKLPLFAPGKLGLSEECQQVNKSPNKSKGALKRQPTDEDHEIGNKKEKRVRKRVEREPVVVNEVTEQLREFITNEMNGSDLKLVIQKNLFASDLKHVQNRLNMPFKQLETHDFLTGDEKELLNRDKVNKGSPKLGIEVGLLGPTLRMYDKPIELRIWDMPRTENYVLIKNWYNFVMDYKNVLKEGTKIQVWSFRINHQLCFAITCVGHKLPNVEEIHDGENDVVAA